MKRGRCNGRGAGGFTLIELLVVIAIIGILAALLFPAVKAAMIRGQSLAVGNDGRQIWLALYAENTEREARGEPHVWPKSGDYASSTEFFRDCMKKNWLGDKFTFSYMGAPGLKKAVTVDAGAFSEVNNAWCVVLDAGPDTKEETPFLFTRNLAAGGGHTLRDVNGLDRAALPFGDAAGVVITFGGGMRFVGKKEAEDFQKAFNPLEEQNAFLRP